MSVDAEPALILHARAYRETSLLLECLTPGYGRVGMIAKGVRRERSRLPRGTLQPLQPLHLSWVGKGELMTMTRAEATAGPYSMPGDRIYSAMYINELVLRLCARGDPHSELFDHYVLCLHRLAGGEPEAWTLRRFERDLMYDLGYGLVLDRNTETGEPLVPSIDYAYAIDAGPRPARGHQNELRIKGSALVALQNDEMPSSRENIELKRFMRVLLQHQLGGGTLNAWSMRVKPTN
ncbi:MAG TPA: DNA repair protein RecO [Dokdonella sp.]|uniref:DNA repair protein RecO n=1 Tax=Dokdonella sp. TaxID=2291710 RepID=UPI002D809ED6|nr:DNA repair protein RecO [Dokdonella sp.]HET9032523.1 DNA repair protein RecO [Dokdonella sp.]